MAYPVQHFIQRLTSGAAILALVAGCVGPLGTTASSLTTSEIGAVSYKAPSRIGGPASGSVARMFHSACIVPTNPNGKESAILIDTLAPILIGAGVDLVQNLLSEAGEDKATAVYASLATRIKSGNPGAGDTGGSGAGSGAIITGDTAGTDTTPPAPPTPPPAETTPTVPAVTTPEVPAVAPVIIPSPLVVGTSSGTPLSPLRSELGSGDCIQFVFGTFAANEAGMPAQTWYTPAMRADLGVETMTSSVFRNKLAARNIFLATAAPDFFLEARFIGGAGTGYLRPTLLSYNSALESGRLGDTRTLLVEYGFNAPTKSLGMNGSKSGVLVLGEMTAGETGVALLEGDPRIPPVRWFVNTMAPATPEVNVEMRVIELSRGNPVAAALAKPFADAESRKTLANQLRQEFFPTATEEQTVFTNQIARLTKYQDELQNLATTRTAALAKITELEADVTLDTAARDVAIALQRSQISVAETRAKAAATAAGIGTGGLGF